MAAIAIFWLAAFVLAFRSHGLAAWSIGVAFIVYDFAHLMFINIEARKLFAQAPPMRGQASVSVGVVVAAYDEAAALGPTLEALLKQSSPPDQILVADDGSEDGSGEMLVTRYRFSAPSLGGRSQSPVAPTLQWLRLPHRGKARALNSALDHVVTEVVVTVDADTRLAPDAIAEIRRAFADDPRPCRRRRRAGAALSRRRRRQGFADVPALRIYPQLPRPLRLVGAGLAVADLRRFCGFPHLGGARGRRLRSPLPGRGLRTHPPPAPTGALARRACESANPRPGRSPTPMRRPRSRPFSDSGGAGSPASCRLNTGTAT